MLDFPCFSRYIARFSRSIEWCFLRAACVLLLGLISVAVPAQERAGGTPLSFDIASQPLHLALDEFARQTGMQVSAGADLVAEQQSSSVSGRYTPGQALEVLLQGTGLRWYFLGDATVVLQQAERNGSAMLPKVQVKAATETSPREAAYSGAGSSNYLSQSDIERNRGLSVGDMFRGTTGVLVAENRNSGGLNINIRGMQGQGRVPVLVDGARQETTVNRGYAGATSRSYVDPDLIGGVSIDKGPTMDPQGTGATGGLVSMKTLNADDIAKPGNTWGLRVRGALVGNNSGTPAEPGTSAGYAVARARSGISLGGQNSYRVDCRAGSSLCSGEHDIANVYGTDETLDRPDLLDLKGHAYSVAGIWRLPWVDLIAAYASREQGNYYAGKDGPTPSLDLSERYNRGFYTEVRPRVEGASRFRAEERIVNSNYTSDSLLLKTTFYPADEQTLEFSYLQYDSDYGELMPSQLIWLGRIRQTENSTVSVDTYTGRYQWESERDWLDLELRLWLTDTESLNNSYSENQAELLAQRPGAEHYQRHGGDLSNTMQFEPWGELEWRYGLAWQFEDVKPENDETTASSPVRDGEREEWSAFTALKWKPVSALTLETGIRYTRYDSDDRKPVQLRQDSPYCQSAEQGDCADLFLSSSNSGSAPMASILWEPWQGIQFYAQYVEALRMPSLFETTAGFSVAASPGVTLKPEHAKNREVGFNLMKNGVLSEDDALRFKAAYFHNRTEDYLTRTIPNAWEDTSAGQNAAMFRMRNIDSVAFQGAELSLEYDIGWLFAELSGTRYFDIELCHAGSYRRDYCTDYGIATSYVNNMLPPNSEASATLGTRLFSRTLELGVKAQWMGERNQVPEYNNQTETGLGFATPIPWHRYTLVDVYATWEPSDTFSLDFAVDNVTDQYYLDALSLGMVPAPGRTATLSATLHF
ncbi:TonB-dependent receptor domain-containing protein [Marinimicrobium sp. ARAG 43.8]|uniref:TonB-dependent receptor n=1 Tax=Marinimicrobium sp. ARAG 43.8 TaxID=3418719 RepID=UPI003CF4C1D1